ncbi:MAG: flavodoxin domain-containing protein [Anaerolineae bacterium]|nr:flavodoxin domain-containing protein [Anaerolineae bacterium]
MTANILVTYASRTGSTIGVANAIGSALMDNGLQTSVYPMSDINDLSGYDAIVAGSAIREGQWLPEALDFIRAHQAVLMTKPFASFMVCMTMAMNNPKAPDMVREWMRPVRQMVKPVSEGYFAGILDISKVPTMRQRLLFRMSVLAGVWTEGDHRDWGAIRAWANSLPALLYADSPNFAAVAGSVTG